MIEVEIGKVYIFTQYQSIFTTPRRTKMKVLWKEEACDIEGETYIEAYEPVSDRRNVIYFYIGKQWFASSADE